MAEREIIGKSEIVDLLASDKTLKHFEMTKADIRRVLDAYYGLVVSALADGKDVRVTGFGKFTVRHHVARTGHNPQTGKAIEIPASYAPAFKPGRKFKEAVNK